MSVNNAKDLTMEEEEIVKERQVKNKKLTLRTINVSNVEKMCSRT